MTRLAVAETPARAGIRATVDGFDPVERKISDLGVEDRDYSDYFGYRYRFRPRWTVSGTAYGFSEAGTRRVAEDFNYDGVEYSAGVELTTRLEVDAYIAYGLAQGITVALGYQRTDIDATLDQNRSESNFDISLDGFTFPFAYSF